MRERGLLRARLFSRERWQQRFAPVVEHILTQPARLVHDRLEIEPLRSAVQAASGARTLLLPARLCNAGTHAAVPDGPSRVVLCCEVRQEAGKADVATHAEMRLPALLIPGQTQVAALPIPLPTGIGSYRVLLWLHRTGTMKPLTPDPVELPLTIEARPGLNSTSCVSTFLSAVEETLPKTHHLQQLPEGYVDVTEGRFAPLKRMVKRKLLNNFKHAYVDVLSRQQSQVNRQVVLMIQQLAECCSMLDHAVAGLHQRLDALQAKMEEAMLAFGACDETAKHETQA